MGDRDLVLPGLGERSNQTVAGLKLIKGRCMRTVAGMFKSDRCGIEMNRRMP